MQYNIIKKNGDLKMKKFIHYILPALLALSFLLSSCSAVAEKPETDTDTEAISESSRKITVSISRRML